MTFYNLKLIIIFGYRNPLEKKMLKQGWKPLNFDYGMQELGGD